MGAPQTGYQAFPRSDSVTHPHSRSIRFCSTEPPGMRFRSPGTLAPQVSEGTFLQVIPVQFPEPKTGSTYTRDASSDAFNFQRPMMLPSHLPMCCLNWNYATEQRGSERTNKWLKTIKNILVYIGIGELGREFLYGVHWAQKN